MGGPLERGVRAENRKSTLAGTLVGALVGAFVVRLPKGPRHAKNSTRPRVCKPWFPNRGSRLPAEPRLN